MFRSPNQFPLIEWMVDDIPASPRQIASKLGVSMQTLKRYIKTGNAPKAVYIALFWETRWGRSAADCEAANFGMVHKAHAESLEGYVQTLREKIQLLEVELSKLAGQRAANLPIFRIQ